ncbi:MAG TPA: AI-2E family transporter YdiK [Burkholderiaceae bacterium]|nr:AI-2E family transporter YdiK [Burkholderiaceae bacterium]
MAEPQRDLTRTLLGVLSLGMLIAASFWILLPFFVPAIWATMIVVTTWPVLLWMQARLWRRRWLAVTAMTLVLLLAFVLPLSWAIGTVALNAEEIVEQAKALASFRMPEPPRWIADLPFVGRAAAQAWQQAAASGVEGLMARLTPYVGGATRWLVASAGNVGYLSLQFLLTLVLAAIMYAHGEKAAASVRRFGRRIAGERGETSVKVAGQAVRGVVLGVGVTAVVQSVLGGVGLAIAGVAVAGLLTVLMFVLCLAQLGPSLVLIPAVVWVYWNGEIGWGTFLLVWSVIVSTADNFLRPLLIRRGADMPLLLVFAGVIGGLFAFGLVGIFVGPVVLAVAYKLLETWLSEEERPMIATLP